MELEWITPQQAADKWGISARRVQALCANGQIIDVKRLGHSWLIPKNSAKPIDGRCRNGRKPLQGESKHKERVNND